MMKKPGPLGNFLWQMGDLQLMVYKYNKNNYRIVLTTKGSIKSFKDVKSHLTFKQMMKF